MNELDLYSLDYKEALGHLANVKIKAGGLITGYFYARTESTEDPDGVIIYVGQDMYIRILVDDIEEFLWFEKEFIENYGDESEGE